MTYGQPEPHNPFGPPRQGPGFGQPGQPQPAQVPYGQPPAGQPAQPPAPYGGAPYGSPYQQPPQPGPYGPVPGQAPQQPFGAQPPGPGAPGPGAPGAPGPVPGPGAPGPGGWSPVPQPPVPETPVPEPASRKAPYVETAIPVVTTATLAGREVAEVVGVVVGVTTRSRDVKVGPETLALLTRARQDAVAAMVEQAVDAGADAVVEVRFDGGKIAGALSEVTAYGTAVRLVPAPGADADESETDDAGTPPVSPATMLDTDPDPATSQPAPEEPVVAEQPAPFEQPPA